jgi:prolyl oligopeptidase
MRDPSPPPGTPRRPVTDVYHGTKVVDEYRWLEDGSDPRVVRWGRAQDRRTTEWLQRSPHRHRVLREVLSSYRRGRWNVLGIWAQSTPRGGAPGGPRIFVLRSDPDHPRPCLWVYGPDLDPRDGHLLLDPAQLGRGNEVSLDLVAPSPGGSRVAVCLSQGGSEQGPLKVLDVARRRWTGETLPRVHGATAGGSAAWTPDGRGIHYTRYPGEERREADRAFFQRVYHHVWGSDPSKDREVVLPDLPRDAEIRLAGDPETGSLLVSVAHGDGGEFSHYLRTPEGRVHRLSGPKDGIKRVVQGKEGLFLLDFRGDTGGRVLRLPPGRTRLAEAEELLPAGPWSCEELCPHGGSVYVAQQRGGVGRLLAIPLGEAAPRPRGIATPAFSEPWSLTGVPGGDLLFLLSQYREPRGVWALTPGARRPRRSPLTFPPLPVLEGLTIRQEFATSRDGTKVPLTLLLPRGFRRHGPAPLLLEGYGGYGISLGPDYELPFAAWYQEGGARAVAHLRGGGEFGEAWHKDGMLTRKQNVFDDFIACAEHLIQRGYVRPGRLAVLGGSNGGLTVGALLTQRPELAGAVLADVGVFDALRSEVEANGEFNIPEFGTVRDPGQFRALYAYSPYHRVTPGTPYPAVLLATGENDHRVNPFHSRKMIARLQASSTSGRPLLLRAHRSFGHGPQSLEDVTATLADRYTFLLEVLPRGRSADPSPSEGRRP